MALLTQSWWLDSAGILTALVAVLYTWMNSRYSYWSKKGIRTPPVTFLFGNAKELFKQESSIPMIVKGWYDYFKSHKLPHGGVYSIFATSVYMPMDPEIIKNILQRDFDHFVDRGMYFNEKDDPLSAHLFSIEGAKWRSLRMKLTPTFTSGKMKMMFDTLVKCGDQLTEEMDKSAGEDAVDIKDFLVRFTTDIIGNCAFGIDCDSLKNPDNEFNRYGKLFFQRGFWENIKGFFQFIAPSLMRRLGTVTVRPQLAEFFMEVVKQTVDYREKNGVSRKDFMQLLIQLKNRGRLDDDDRDCAEHEEGKLTIEEIAAQALVFFIAGFETSSTTMTFCLYELARNKDAQQNLRKEINEVLRKHDGSLTYGAINEMHYMEKVINETLRKYPPLPLLFRMCTKDYRVPGTDVIIEKGVPVNIPVMGLHRDEEYYPDPEKFDPERFSEENKRSRHPYTFLPFGEGPRNCIGLRFGMMQTKVGLSVLLKNYEFSVSPKTAEPLKLAGGSFITTTEGGIWLSYTKI